VCCGAAAAHVPPPPLLLLLLLPPRSPLLMATVRLLGQLLRCAAVLGPFTAACMLEAVLFSTSAIHIPCNAVLMTVLILLAVFCITATVTVTVIVCAVEGRPCPGSRKQLCAETQ
jgi:hypothetical protein